MSDCNLVEDKSERENQNRLVYNLFSLLFISCESPLLYFQVTSCIGQPYNSKLDKLLKKKRGFFFSFTSIFFSTLDVECKQYKQFSREKVLAT